MNHIDRKVVLNYFAYGSNMDPARMKERGVMFYSGELLILPGYSLKFHKITPHGPNTGAANIVPDEKGVVEGILYEITWAGIRNLDKYEGYPTEYNRLKLKVTLSEGTEKEIITYMAHPHRTQEGLKPARFYLEHLLQAEDILSEDYYNQLKVVETSD